MEVKLINRKPYIGKWIFILYRVGQSFFDKCFAKYGIGSGQYPFLLALSHKDGVTQDMLTRRLNVDKATTTRAIVKLESLGYVVRISDPDDKRAYLVYLTDRGREIEPYIRNVLKDWAALITEGFTEEERAVAYNLLKRMAEQAIVMKEQKFPVN